MMRLTPRTQPTREQEHGNSAAGLIEPLIGQCATASLLGSHDAPCPARWDPPTRAQRARGLQRTQRPDSQAMAEAVQWIASHIGDW